MRKVTNILLTGVGGQGIILASRVLAKLALSAGYDVKVSEIHGMAQRGGSVVTHLRFGDKVFSPLISFGQADYLVSFEKLEAVRCLPFLKKDGCLIVNDQEIFPLPVLLGKSAYPSDLDAYLKKQVARIRLIPAQEQAQQLGSLQVVNMILLGVLAQYLKNAGWDDAIKQCLRPELVPLNQEAFSLGLNAQNIKDN